LFSRITKEVILFGEGWMYRVREDKGDAIAYNIEEKKIRFFLADGKQAVLDGYALVYLEPTMNCFVVSTGSEEDAARRYGIADFTGKILVPCTHGYMNIWNDRFFSVTVPARDDKGRSVSRYELYEIATNKKAVPEQFEGIELFSGGGVALRDSKSWKLYDENLKRWDDFEYTSVYRGQRLNAYSRSLPLYEVRRTTAQNQSVVGYVDGTARPVIPAIYNEVRLIASNYNDGHAAPMRINAITYEDNAGVRTRRGVLLDPNGKQIPLPAGVSALGYEMNNLFTAYRDVRYEDETRSFCGLIDSMGNVVLPLEYDEVRQTGQGLGFTCTRNGAVTLADRNGKLIAFFPGYTYVSPLSNGFYMGQKQGEKVLLSAAGKAMTAVSYDEIYHPVYLNGTLFRVKKNNVEYYIDTNGTPFYEP
jgi:hypothetical protein